MKRTLSLILLSALTAASSLCGCAGTGRSQRGPASSIHQVSRIEILPFTRIASLDTDRIPDGLEVVVRPIDPLGDAAKVTGHFQFELFMFRKASPQNTGERIQFWQVDVGSVGDQRRYWDRLTRTYQFPLAFDRPMPMTRRQFKCVLQVTYTPDVPDQDRLFAQRVLEFEADEQLLRLIRARAGQ